MKNAELNRILAECDEKRKTAYNWLMIQMTARRDDESRNDREDRIENAQYRYDRIVANAVETQNAAYAAANPST